MKSNPLTFCTSICILPQSAAPLHIGAAPGHVRPCMFVACSCSELQGRVLQGRVLQSVKSNNPTLKGGELIYNHHSESLVPNVYCPIWICLLAHPGFLAGNTPPIGTLNRLHNCVFVLLSGHNPHVCPQSIGVAWSVIKDLPCYVPTPPAAHSPQ